jgi:hypothetical protein
VRDAMGRKQSETDPKECRKCRKLLNLSEFRKRNDSPSHASRCKECAREDCKLWRQRNPHKQKNSTVNWQISNPDKYKTLRFNSDLKRYGLTIKSYKVLVDKQAGVCAICGESETTFARLSVDHCHISGRIRGLLCNNCNRGIGLLKDSATILLRAHEYLSA